ncbi:MAG TPA: hypothetical protein VFO41_14405 [Alphaproteobacteria bacterium]|nr:hypothetical protein [Alphaproteobacteria bacterium]
MVYTFAHLDEAGVRKLQDLEAEIGKPLLAVDCRALRPADIDEAATRKIGALESELGVVLLAVDTGRKRERRRR